MCNIFVYILTQEEENIYKYWVNIVSELIVAHNRRYYNLFATQRTFVSIFYTWSARNLMSLAWAPSDLKTILLRLSSRFAWKWALAGDESLGGIFLIELPFYDSMRKIVNANRSSHHSQHKKFR